MYDKHYKDQLSALVNHELAREDSQAIAEHLLLCEECRREHDTIKLGASFAAELKRADAPDTTWANIAEVLDGHRDSQMGLMPQSSFWTARRGFAFAASLVAVSAVSALVYIGLFSGDSPYRARTTEIPVSSNSTQVAAAVNAAQPVNAATDAIVNTANTNIANANTAPAPITDKPGWQVEAIAGTPKSADGTAIAKIAIGELLETDAASSARISVADIGTVDIAPSSRIKLVGTGKDEHRLALEKGKLHAKIFAPPRIFVVDTPSGKAVDLGCEYTLEVDAKGDSILNVTGGFVALERAGRESVVPAGMMCRMRKGKGVGTPFSADATAKFRSVLERFDFSGGGSTSVSELIAEAQLYDMVTLWHLLSRVPKADRGAVFDALAKFVKPPSNVTRDGIIALDKKMLATWRKEVEATWFN